MRISKTAILLSTAGVGLTLVYSQQSTSDTQTKAQQILRQKLSELKSGETLPGKAALLADIERLHKEGKISDEQFASFKKNINEKYSSPGGPDDSEVQAKAQRILEERLAAEKAGAQPSNSEIQAKAQKAMEETAKAQARKTAAAAAQPTTPTASEQALRQKISDLKAEEKPVVAASNTEAQAKALKVLEEQRAAQKPPPPTKPSTAPTTVAEKAQKVAEPKVETKPVVTASNTEAQAKALKVLEEQRTAQKAPPPTKPSTTQTTVAEKAPQQKVAQARAEEPKAVGQAKAVAPVQAGDAEERAGITPETPRRTRLLRLKIAESKGLIAPEEAAQIAAATPSGLPVFTSNMTGTERLRELNNAYMDDRITPSEYHRERAKIVSSF